MVVGIGIRAGSLAMTVKGFETALVVVLLMVDSLFGITCLAATGVIGTLLLVAKISDFFGLPLFSFYITG